MFCMLKSQMLGKSSFHALMEENIRQRSLPGASDDDDDDDDFWMIIMIIIRLILQPLILMQIGLYN